MAKVIASSLRKGNVVDLDGRLYVVLTAQNIHPGKGTPVTQLDLRRISDGVKISERYRTTEQVERAFVESQEHSFLYEDASGYHFMNPDSYEQVTVTPSELTVRKVSHHGRISEWTLNPLWVRLERVVHEEFGIERLFLVSHGRQLPIASFLGPQEKESLAVALSAALGEAKRGPTRTVFN